MRGKLYIAGSLLVGTALAGIAGPAWAQTPPTEQQILQAAQQLSNQQGFIADRARGAANWMSGGMPGAATTQQDAAQTSFGAFATGVGAPILSGPSGAGMTLDDIYNSTELSGRPDPRLQAQQIRAQQHTGPGFYTQNIDNYGNPVGPPDWHPLPAQPIDYSQMDAYLANRPQITRDPFARPASPTPTAPTQTAPEPFVYPPLPGPDYPLARPRQPTQTSQPNPADVQAIAAALGSAMGTAMGGAFAQQHVGDAAAIAGEAAGQVIGQSALDAGNAIAAAVLSGGASAPRNPYDMNANQPMPMFTVRSGPGGITDSNNMYATQVAELLPIYEGYDPFASGRLVPWPASTMFPSVYQPTGMSLAGLGGYSLADPHFMTPQTISSAYDLLYPGQNFGFQLDPRLSNSSLTPVGGRYAGQVINAGWMISRQTMPGWENWNLPWSTVFGDPNLTARQRDVLMAALNPNVQNVLFGYGGAGALSTWGSLVGNLAGLSESELIRLTSVRDAQGLTALLSQPFNVLLTWGPGAYDLDLHMTGPDGAAGRFHVYYADRGSLDVAPFAQLVVDCICTGGSEVIVTSNLSQGGVYRVSVFNFGDQSATSTNLSNNSSAVLSIVRGGTPVGVGQGTTIQGGTVLFSRGVPGPNLQGNTWRAVEINPANGRIFDVSSIGQSASSAAVQ